MKKICRFRPELKDGLLRLTNYQINRVWERNLSLVNSGGARAIKYLPQFDPAEVKLFARRIPKDPDFAKKLNSGNTKWEYSFSILDGKEGLYIKTFPDDWDQEESEEDEEEEHKEEIENLMEVKAQLGRFFATIGYTKINSHDAFPESEFTLRCKNGFVWMEDFETEGYFTQIKTFGISQTWVFVVLPDLKSIFHYKLRAVFQPKGGTIKHETMEAFSDFFLDHFSMIVEVFQELLKPQASQTPMDLEYVRHTFWMLREMYRLILEPIGPDIVANHLTHQQLDGTNTPDDIGSTSSSDESDGWGGDQMENNRKRRAAALNKKFSPKKFFKHEHFLLQLAREISDKFTEDLNLESLVDLTRTVIGHLRVNNNLPSFFERHRSHVKFHKELRTLGSALIFETRSAKIQTAVLKDCPPFCDMYSPKVFTKAHKYFCPPTDSSKIIRSEWEVHHELFDWGRGQLLTMATPEYITTTLKRGVFTEPKLEVVASVQMLGYRIDVLGRRIEFTKLSDSQMLVLEFPQPARIYHFKFCSNHLILDVDYGEEQDSEKTLESIIWVPLDRLHQSEGGRPSIFTLISFEKSLSNSDMDAYGDLIVLCTEPISVDPMLVSIFKVKSGEESPALLHTYKLSELLNIPESTIDEMITYETAHQVSSSMEEFDTGATSISVCFEAFTKLHGETLLCLLYDYETDENNMRIWYGLHSISREQSQSTHQMRAEDHGKLIVPKEPLQISKICIPGFIRIVKSSTMYWLTMAPSLDYMIQVVRHHKLQTLQSFRLGQKMYRCLRDRVPPLTQVHLSYIPDQTCIRVTLESEMTEWMHTEAPSEEAVTFLLKL